MSRDVQFEEKAICDGCGIQGAFDFMGDFLCQKCLAENFLVNNYGGFMIGRNKTEQDFETRKEYLVWLAIQYIENHTGYVGMDDDVFFDKAKCDGYALAEDLRIEFDIDK